VAAARPVGFSLQWGGIHNLSGFKEWLIRGNEATDTLRNVRVTLANGGSENKE
jgi:hypothetical protein